MKRSISIFIFALILCVSYVYAQSVWKPFQHEVNINAEDTTLITGKGRYNCVLIHPDHPDTLWAGAAQGGVWKSTNRGLTWNYSGTGLPWLTIGAMAVNLKDPNVIWLASGDPNLPDADRRYEPDHFNRGAGVFISRDGGQSWQSTGLDFQPFTDLQHSVLSGLVIHATDTASVVAGGGDGLYRTTDSGQNWLQTLSGYRISQVLNHPAGSDTVWACSQYRHDLQTGVAAVWLSSDFGFTWTIVNTGAPAGLIQRMTIAGAEPASQNIFLLACDTLGGFYGLAKSNNGGANWTWQTATINIMGRMAGIDTGGTGFSYQSLLVKNGGSDTLLAGSYDIWMSPNGGQNWELLSWHQRGSGSGLHYGQTHMKEDITDGRLWVCTAGGLAWTDQSWQGINPQTAQACLDTNAVLIPGCTSFLTSWQKPLAEPDVTEAMQIAVVNSQLGAAYLDTAIAVATMANGTQLYVHTLPRLQYLRQKGNTPAFYNETHDLEVPAERPAKTWTYTALEQGIKWHNIAEAKPTLFINTGWFWSSSWIDVDKNGNWGLIELNPMDTLSPAKILKLTQSQVLASCSDYTYFILNTQNEIYKYEFWELCGGPWTESGLSRNKIKSACTQVDCDIVAMDAILGDSARLFYAISGDGYGNKVIMMNIASVVNYSYEDITYNLPPDVRIYCLTAQYRTHNSYSHTLYAGTSHGVYMMRRGANTWIQYGTDLPNVPVTSIDIDYAGSNMIVAGTQGRGVWVIPAFESSRIEPLRTEEYGMDENWTVFPNPARPGNELTISNHFFKDRTNINLSLSDVNGKELYHLKTSDENAEKTFFHLPLTILPGIYFLSWINDNTRKYSRLIIVD